MQLQQHLQFPNGNGKYQIFDCRSDCKSSGSLIFAENLEHPVGVKTFPDPEYEV